MCMVNEKSFEEIAEEIHNQNEREIFFKSIKNELTGQNVYTTFCVWCNAFNKGNGKNDNETFKKFLDEQNVELTFWQKKHLAEKYFGYEYCWDTVSNKWLIRKKSV